MNRRVLLFCGVILGAACGTGGGNGGSTAPAKPAVASLVLTLPSGVLVEGDSATASVVVTDATGNPLTGRAIEWTSSAPAIAMVSSSGVVWGVAPGAATIIASSEGISDSASIRILRSPLIKDRVR